MDNYLTANLIKELREKQNLKQIDLAEKLSVSDKTISKWETGRGLPDITLIEPLAKILNVSVTELMSGTQIVNENKSCNMLKSYFSVCPICNNVIFAMGENLNVCCGVNLPSLDAEEASDKHELTVEKVENEIFVSLNHSMSKTHYISFIAYKTYDRCEIVKLYPEQNACARFFNKGKGEILFYCNKDGLFKKAYN